MRTIRIIIVAALVTLLTTAILVAQEAKKPPLSPPAKAEATIGGKKITIDYSSPRMRERKIMGGLVPFDEVWRTGANAATTLSTEADLMIGDLHVPAGKYTLFTIPSESQWTLIVNKQTGQWGTNYDTSQDLGRVKMKVSKLESPLEEFTIEIKPGEGHNGTLSLRWETTEASVPIMVH